MSDKLYPKPTTVEHNFNLLQKIVARLPDNKTLIAIICALTIFLVTFGLRAFNLPFAYDVFIDEVTYVEIAKVVQADGWPSLYDEPFYLHPPAQFYAQAFFLSIAQPALDTFEQVHTARYLNIIFSALTAVAMFDIVRRIIGTSFGLMVGFIFALDAFIIRNNSLNLLDTGTIWWITLGYWILIAGMDEENHYIAWWRIILIGICFGLGVLTKDMGAFLTIIPMGGLFLMGWGITRLSSFFIGCVTVIVYSIYPFTVYFRGEWSYFFEEKFVGLLRFIGAKQSTGFNRGTGPSLIEKIIEKLLDYGTTYMIIAAGAVAVVILLRYGNRHSRIVAAWSGGSYAMMAYSILFGTLEEQFFYFLIVPAIMGLILMIEKLLTMTESVQWLQRLLTIGTVLFFVIFTSFSAQAWIVQHLTYNNGYQQIYDYLQRYSDFDENIASSSETGQFIFGEYSSGPWGLWHTVEEINRYQPEYIMLNYDQLDWDFGEDAQPMIDWVQANGLLVLDHRTNNAHFSLYQMSYDDFNAEGS